ncbi:MAG: hypothetical protein LBR41_02505 [Rickettsiales bacterium]|nr:hypothetical protein [Rickettsiales bacterium]
MCRGKHAENCPQRKTRWALLGLGGIAFATVAIFAGTKLSVSAADTENKTLSAPTQRADTVAVAKVMDPRVRD